MTAHLIIILSAMAAWALYLFHARANSIENTRETIARSWTNEGDIASKETSFIDLSLENHDGSIIGSLTSPQTERILSVNVDVGWLWTTVEISELHGRGVSPVATAKVKLLDHNSRLEWRLTSAEHPDFLPKNTLLWPNPVASAP